MEKTGSGNASGPDSIDVMIQGQEGSEDRNKGVANKLNLVGVAEKESKFNAEKVHQGKQKQEPCSPAGNGNGSGTVLTEAKASPDSDSVRSRPDLGQGGRSKER